MLVCVDFDTAWLQDDDDRESKDGPRQQKRSGTPLAREAHRRSLRVCMYVCMCHTYVCMYVCVYVYILLYPETPFD